MFFFFFGKRYERIDSRFKCVYEPTDNGIKVQCFFNVSANQHNLHKRYILHNTRFHEHQTRISFVMRLSVTVSADN